MPEPRKRTRAQIWPAGRGGGTLVIFILAAVSLQGCGSVGGGAPSSAAPLRSISVTPSNDAIAQGSKQQFKAMGTYSDNSTRDLTSTATWSSSSAAVVTVSSTGVADAVGAGSATIEAASGSISGSTTVSVTAATSSQLIQHVV